jgi:protein-tyrosine phosphatase
VLALHGLGFQTGRIAIGYFGFQMRILFVCMGNICRSPTAEGVFRHALAKRTNEFSIEVDSAGTHDYHVGSPPDRRAIAAAARRGIDLSTLRARSIEDHDFERFDLILAMDRENFALLRSRAPREYHSRIRLIMDYAPDSHAREVPDPYYGGAKGFEEVLDLLEQASAGLLAELARDARIDA